MSTLYDDLVNANVPIDHHESDLYFYPNDAAIKILDQYPVERRMCKKFFSESGKEPKGWWIEAPFAYKPYWDEKEKQGQGGK